MARRTKRGLIDGETVGRWAVDTRFREGYRAAMRQLLGVAEIRQWRRSMMPVLTLQEAADGSWSGVVQHVAVKHTIALPETEAILLARLAWSRGVRRTRAELDSYERDEEPLRSARRVFTTDGPQGPDLDYTHVGRCLSALGRRLRATPLPDLDIDTKRGQAGGSRLTCPVLVVVRGSRAPGKATI